MEHSSAGAGTAGRRLSRRQLLGGADAAVPLGAIRTGETSSQTAILHLVGTVLDVQPPMIVVELRDGPAINVDLSTATEVARDGKAMPADFVQGDEVSFEGRLEGDRFVANSFTSLYRLREGKIVGVTGNRIATTNGVIVLSSATEYHPGSGAISLEVGTLVGAVGRLDPRTGDFVAVTIGTARRE